MKKLYYAIGDIHGRHEELLQLLNAIKNDIEQLNGDYECHVIQIGDIIDRGENSKACVESIMNLNSFFPNHVNIHALQGNHEEVTCKLWRNKPEDLQDKEAFLWYHEDIGGGVKTLESYGFEAGAHNTTPPSEEWVMKQVQKFVPLNHINFLESLPVKLELGPYFFCHAGVDPNKKLNEQDEHTLRWIREPFLSHSEAFEKIIVHGHTPAADGEIQHNRVNTDAAAAYGEKLKCFILPEHYKIEDVRTIEVAIKAPSTWGDLEAYKEKIDNAKKAIYNNHP